VGIRPWRAPTERPAARGRTRVVAGFRRPWAALGWVWAAWPGTIASRRSARGSGLPRRLSRALSFEPLEARSLLSAGGVAAPADLVMVPPGLDPISPDGSSSPPGNALAPSQVRGAYGVAGITFSGGTIAGDGRGQTIAIVDAYDDPNALADLDNFSTSAGYALPEFNLPGDPTFQKLNEYGQPAQSTNSQAPGYVPQDPTHEWDGEESLDVEWAHVMAPMANIILFEASDSSGPNLFQAVGTAAGTAGVVAVSMSWGFPEADIGSILGVSEPAADAYFTTPGVTFLAASGDSGAYAPGTTDIEPQYPADSPNVVAVGGTTLSATDGSETAWGNGTSSGTLGGGGGGVSQHESQPAYQSGVVPTTMSELNGGAAMRAYPDVSADANTGVAVYDSYNFGTQTPWVLLGGTSPACPLWAGIVAVADEGRAIAGLGSLDGPSQTLPTLYSLRTTSGFHDITYDTSTGSSPGNTLPGPSIGPTPTYSPATGYDLATGIGSPQGNPLIGALATTPTLYWTGSTDSYWNLASSDWETANDTPTPWISGANAVFNGTATAITIPAGVNIAASSIAFEAPNLFTISGAGTLSLPTTGTTITVDRGVTATISCTISGSGGLTASGAGTLALAGSNSYTGGSFVCCSLAAESPHALPSGGLLDIEAGGSVTLGVPGHEEPLSLGPVDIGCGATLDLAGYDVTAAAVTVEDGTVTDGWLSVDGDQLTVESGTISADLTGDIALVKTGPGTVVLSGDNDYTGGTTLESGTLRVAGSDALGGGGLYLNGGTLDLNGFDTTIASLNGSGGTITDDSTTPGTTTLTTSTSACAWYYGAISDGAVRQVAFHVTGGADMVLRGNNTYTGGTIIDAGSWLWSGNDDQGGISGDVVDNGALLFGAAQSFSGAISGSGCVEVRSM